MTGPDPTVRLGPAYVDTEQSGRVKLPGTLVVECSEHGEIWQVDDAQGDNVKNLGRREARRHADELHDGLVITDGWRR